MFEKQGRLIESHVAPARLTRPVGESMHIDCTVLYSTVVLHLHYFVIICLTMRPQVLVQAAIRVDYLCGGADVSSLVVMDDGHRVSRLHTAYFTTFISSSLLLLPPLSLGSLVLYRRTQTQTYWRSMPPLDQNCITWSSSCLRDHRTPTQSSPATIVLLSARFPNP